MKIKEQKPGKPKYARKTWVFRRAKNSKIFEHVRICPKCGSLDIEILNITKQYTFAFGLPTTYKCRNCGFSNYVFPEIDSNDLKKIKPLNKNKK